MLSDPGLVGTSSVLCAARGGEVPFYVDLANHKGDIGQVGYTQGQVELGLCPC